MKYYIRRSGKPPLEVSYEGTPPCLYCGRPVDDPSMDGPLVCGACDSGYTHVDGVVRKWTASEYAERKKHRIRVLGEIEAAMNNATSCDAVE